MLEERLDLQQHSLLATQRAVLTTPLAERHFPDWIFAIGLVGYRIDNENVDTVVQGVDGGIDIGIDLGQIVAGYKTIQVYYGRDSGCFYLYEHISCFLPDFTYWQTQSGEPPRVMQERQRREFAGQRGRTTCWRSVLWRVIIQLLGNVRQFILSDSRG